MDLDLFQTVSYVDLFKIICNFSLGKMSYCLIKLLLEQNIFLFNRTSKCKLHMVLDKVRIGFNLYRLQENNRFKCHMFFRLSNNSILLYCILK